MVKTVRVNVDQRVNFVFSIFTSKLMLEQTLNNFTKTTHRSCTNELACILWMRLALF